MRSNSSTIRVVNEKTSVAFKKALDCIWDKYKMYDGTPLSEMTHRQGSIGIKRLKEMMPIYPMQIF